jgi:hypothetical protein
VRFRIQQNSLRIRMDEPPLAIGGHRVRKFLPQEAPSIGHLRQFLDAGRVSLELLVEVRDSARVLPAAEDEFLFALALVLLVDAGQRDSQADQQDSGRYHDKQQRVTGIGSCAADRVTAGWASQRFGEWKHLRP